MELTVGLLKEFLNMYPDDSPVEFQMISDKNGKYYQLDFYRLKDRGDEKQHICHFEWNPIKGLET